MSEKSKFKRPSSFRLKNSEFFSVNFCPTNGSLLALTKSDSGAGEKSSLLIIEMTPKRKLKPIVLFNHDSILHDAAWCEKSKNPSIIVTASSDGNLQIWNMFAPNRGNEIISAHNHVISSLKWFENTNRIISASYDQSLKLWDLATKKLIKAYRTGGENPAVDIHPNNENVFASVCYDRVVRLWDTRTHERLNAIGFKLTIPNSIAWSKYCENMIATCGDDGHINGWDLRKCNDTVFRLGGPEETSLRKIKFSPCSYEPIVSVGVDGRTRFWKCSDEVPYSVLNIQNHTSQIHGLDWFYSENEGSHLATCAWDGFLHVFDTYPI